MAQVTDVKGTNETADTKVNFTGHINVNLITKEELNSKIQSGELMQIINVLDLEFYKLGFIKGSKRIPLHQLDARLGELNKSIEVVTYCASSACNASKHAAELLVRKGFRVTAYEGGIKEWKEAGLPTETE